MNDKIKNIAIICHDFTLSGANKSLLDWVVSSNNNRYKIICVIPRKGKQFEEICNKNNIEVIRGNYIVTQKYLYKPPFKRYIKNIFKNIFKIFINPISFVILKNKLKRRQVRLIHSNSFAVLIGVKLAISMKIPHLWHIREFMEEDHKITHFENKNKIKEYCEYSSAIFISDVIKNKYNNLFSKNIKKVIYDKVNFDKNYSKQKNLLEKDECNVLIAGTLSINKNQIEAIKAIEEIIKNEQFSNIKLFICGQGDNEEYLRQYVDKNKMNDFIEFMGQVNNLTEFRKNMDIALICSKSEALGRVTIEAMYYENLVIGANIGCTPYIIKNQVTGLLYDYGNYKQLSEKIIWVIKNKDESVKIIEQAQKDSINKYYKNNYIEEIFNIYDKMLDI